MNRLLRRRSKIDPVQQLVSEYSPEELRVVYFAISDFEEVPVDINTFLDDPKFLGSYFEGHLWSHWREVLNEIYPPSGLSKFWMAAFKGAIGTGKTTAACAGICYDLYRLLCLRSPQLSMGLVPTTKILFAIFNVTKELAQDVVWDILSNMLVSSEYLRGKLSSSLSLKSPRLGRKPGYTSLFSKRIDFFSGSRVSHSLGKSIYSAVMDEANFEIIGGQVYKTFLSVTNRMESRFMETGGGVPGRIWIISSESEKASVLNNIISDYSGSTGVFVTAPSLWQAKPFKYSGKTFQVFPGSETKAAFILDAGQKYQLNAEEVNEVVKIPIEHKASFVADVDAALRDLAGIQRASKYKLFKLQEKVTASMTVPSLFMDVFSLSFDDHMDQVRDYLTNLKHFDSVQHPEAPRFVHLDVGLTGDRLGIACCYISGSKNIRVIDPVTLKQVVETVPEITVEWAFGLEPKQGAQIPLYKLRMWIIWLSDKGVPVLWISADGFQSADFLQMMSLLGYQTKPISVDKTSAPYFNLRNAIYESRCYLPSNLVLKSELLGLEVSPDSKKVNHEMRKGASKDISDAVAGCVYNLTQNLSTVMSVAYTSIAADEAAQPKEDLKDLFWGSGKSQIVRDNILNTLWR